MVIAEQNRGWVLDGICRDTAAHLEISVDFCYDLTHLPTAPAYFFSHHTLYARARRARTIPRGARTLVFYTHPGNASADQRKLVRALSTCDQVLSMATMHSRQLLSWGVPADRVTTVLGAADPQMFQPHRRGGGSVGLVSAYYERKAPTRIVGLAQALPERELLLVGRGWDHPEVAAPLARIPNLRIVQAPYREYPEWYGRMDVFVSPSVLEGGPIPLIEAMMSNVVPVATATGFCPDVIQDGVNGYLCGVDASAAEMAELVELAFTNTTDVRPSVEHLSWQRYADILQGFLPA